MNPEMFKETMSIGGMGFQNCYLNIAGKVISAQYIDPSNPPVSGPSVAGIFDQKCIVINTVTGVDYIQSGDPSSSPAWTVIPGAGGTPTSVAIPVVTATAVAGAATADGQNVLITSESLSTAAGSTYVLTLTNSAISATSNLEITLSLGSSTTGIPGLVRYVASSGSAVITIENIDPAAAFGGTITVGVLVLD